MSWLVPVVSILLALLVAGCVAYLAWEVTKEASRSGEASKSDTDDRPD